MLSVRIESTYLYLSSILAIACTVRYCKVTLLAIVLFTVQTVLVMYYNTAVQLSRYNSRLAIAQLQASLAGRGSAYL